LAVYSRVAFAQIAANPAYVDESGNSLLHEPTFPTDDKIGLYTLASIEEIHQFRNKVAAALTAHISAKLEVIAAQAANQGAGLLVLPEYSIPSPVLSACKSLSEGLDITIVAGSHVATQLSLRDCREAGLPSGDELLGRAVCPIFVPHQLPRLRQKITRSKWESSLVAGDVSEPVALSLWGKKVFLQVSICLDAIAAPEAKAKSSKLGPTIYAIPALTPATDLFGDRARLLLGSGHVSVFVNGAEFGGSRAFARAERLNRWYAAEDGTQPLPRHSEALVLLEVDLSSQYEVRKSVAEHFPVQDLKVFPLLYPDASQEASEYAEIVRELKEAGPSAMPGIKERIERFALLDERLFPGLLQEKIKQFFRNVVDLGLANDDAWAAWLEPLVVKATTSTDKLRWELCGEAVELINELLLSEKYAAKMDQLTSVYRAVINRRRELGKRVAASVPSKTISAGGRETAPIVGALSTPFEPPFYDRQSVLNGIRRFVESSASNCLVLAGMRGIGKTSLAKEVFKKVLPPTWRNVWIQLTEGIGYPRLLADIAHKCGIRASAEHGLQKAPQVTVAQDVLLYLSGTPRVALVLDDVQHALDPAGEFAEKSVADLLHNSIMRSSQSRNKIILITTVVPKFPHELRENIEVRYLTGLEREDAENLLSFWYHFEREDLRGQPVGFPDILFKVLAGHPLGLRVAAKMWAETPLEDSELALFKRLREAVVAYILDRVNLTPREEEFIRFASVFRLPVPRGVFLKWRKDEANFMMDSFVGRSFLEADADKYQLHPLIREHFYNSTPTPALQPYHRMAGQFFLDSYARAKNAGLDPDPEDLGEAIFHFLAAGEREKAKSLGLYRYEIRPVALGHYRKREYDLALKNYVLLSQLDPNDVDAHFHLSLIYARQGRWDDAENHFGKAVTLNPRAYWVFQGYAHQKLQTDKIAVAEHLLLQAENIRPDHSATLVDLGRIRLKQGLEAEAEDYFVRSIEADENNPFAYITYARFLLNQGRYEEGLNYALAAVEVNPRDHASRELVNELRRRIQSAQAPPAA
jgi:tetratricopeptide (TPR) repeat protein